MNRILFAIITILGLLTTNINAKDRTLSKQELIKLKKSIKALNKPMLTVKEGLDRGTVYFLKLESKTKRGARILNAFVNKNSGDIYFGKGYDKNGKLISFPKDIKAIKDGVSFSYGDGKKDLYIVTDPECPYCMKFEKASKGKLKDYRVHFILYPLPYHKKAPAMIEWIMQGKDDKDKKSRLEKVMVENSSIYKTLNKDPKKLFLVSGKMKIMSEKSRKAMNELGVRGTPAVFDGEFNPVSWGTLIK
ncbi:MAG: thioredoxin fold domain-containing protein [Sulfurovum sp.]|nr:thioredoxin fold domain-containing protein [Sulfurovaceae bacterium]